MVSFQEVPSLKIPGPWENFDFRQETQSSLRDQLHSMSSRVRDSLVMTMDAIDERAEKIALAAEKVMKYSAAGALASSAAYVAIEALTRSNNRIEAGALFLSAVTIALGAHSRLSGSEIDSLPKWRARRDRW